MTRQEMFDTAVRGLRSQGFERCARDVPTEMPDGTIGMLPMCVYDDGAGRHCAWGWIDSGILPGQSPSIWGRATVDQSGPAAQLSKSDINWAERLQAVHDNAGDPANMELALREFAATEHLVFPEENG